jgi:hypothetical protein
VVGSVPIGPVGFARPASALCTVDAAMAWITFAERDMKPILPEFVYQIFYVSLEGVLRFIFPLFTHQVYDGCFHQT